MKKHFVIFVIIFLATVGYAAANTVLDITGIINVAENIEDFKIEITNLKINNSDSKTLISKDKQSFTFTGSGNDTLEYTVTNHSYQYDANIVLTCSPSDNITVEQISNLPAQSKNSKVITSTSTSEITCTINVEKISRTDYAEDMCKYVEGTVWTFDYTGAEQEFTTPCDGNYKIEAWGAQGGNYNSSYYGGYGAYAFGDISINADQKVFINVGGTGTMASYQANVIVKGGYNGGGDASYNWTSSAVPAQINISGGGSTHLALKSGLLSTLSTHLSSILLVSSGGGGAQALDLGSNQYVYCSGGNGGGIKGSRSICSVNIPYDVSTYEDASQTTPGSSIYAGHEDNGEFGKGGMGYSGGGSGLYGGTGNYRATGGGSSYIGNLLLTNKSMYCYNCAQSSEESTKTISTTCTSSTPTANCAKQGNGYAKITYLGK